jgi:hypothetical protein
VTAETAILFGELTDPSRSTISRCPIHTGDEQREREHSQCRMLISDPSAPSRNLAVSGISMKSSIVSAAARMLARRRNQDVMRIGGWRT